MSTQKIRLGTGKIINFESELVPKSKTLNEESKTNPIQTRCSKFKKARLKRISDLTALLDSDFIELIQEREQISSSRIKINEKI
jgi:hypothetical protein